MSNRWTSDYDSDELQELEREASAIDRRSETIEAEISRLEYTLHRLNEEGTRIEERGEQVAAELRAEDEGITVDEALRLNKQDLDSAAEEAQRDRSTRRMEAGYAQ